MEPETVGFGGEGGRLLFYGRHEAQGWFLYCEVGETELRDGGLGTHHDGRRRRLTRTRR